MFQNPSEVLSFIKERHIENVDLKFASLTGQWHHLSLPASAVDLGLFERGVGFDGSSTGLGVTEAGDMVAIPEPATAFIDPFWERPTLSLLCGVADARTLEPHPLDCRGVAKRAEQWLIESGVADTALFGPEFEYYVFSNVRYTNRSHLSFYVVESGESESESLDGPATASGYGIPSQRGYHALPPQDQYRDIRCETVAELAEVGVDVRYHHHEVGASGQQEIEVRMGPLLRMADVSMLVKYVVRNVAARHGLVATFMPKPIYGEAGSGMHFHQLLRKGDEYPFFDESGYAGLSSVAHSYIAGVLQHAPALVAITNPSTNSYRRLVEGFEAPVLSFFSLANRSAAVRIPRYANAPESKRFEFRPPDATCNPYLAMAAQLMAGLDGVRRKLDPCALGFGPHDEDLFDPKNADLAASIPSLPRQLDAALEALGEDQSFLIEGGVFTPQLLRAYVALKRDRDLAALQQRPHPYEMALYLNC